MIEIKFHKGGFVTLTPKEYKGETCHKATAPYTEKFGGPQTVTPTEDAVVANSNVQQQKAEG